MRSCEKFVETVRSKRVKAVLCDIHGVLFDNDEGVTYPVPGSVDAFNRLVRSSGLAVRLVSNESACPPDQVLKHCHEAGLEVSLNHIFVTTPAAYKIISEKKLRPYVLVHKNVESYFATLDQSNPNCVLIGDAVDNFDYNTLNSAFKVLVDNPGAELFSLGMGKYYKKGGSGELSLDVGPFAKALEFATGVTAQVVGKPSKAYFDAALRDIGVEGSEAVMIGDDIVNDVGGAQKAGVATAILTRTGKYRPSDEVNHPSSVKPDLVVDNFAAFVNLVMDNI